MKRVRWIVAVALVLAVVPACKKKELTAAEKMKERMDDALNRRPNEELRDAVEDAEKAAKNVVKEAKAAAEKKVEEVKSLGLPADGR